MINASISKKKRKAVYARDGYRCALCDGSTGLQIHHAIPRGQGGSDSLHNLITLCAKCHAEVHGVIPYDMEITPEELGQYCIEYLADMYAPNWNPWKPGEVPFLHTWVEPWRRRHGF